jgi:tetratricopeptide (TPR) repeat protein
MSQKKQKGKTAHKPNISAKDSAKGKATLLNLVYLAILIIAVQWVYTGASEHSFVNWDDQVYVEEQPLVLQRQYSELWKTPVSLNYHPVTMTSLAMQAPKESAKLSAGPFIRLNILFHMANTLLVFLFIGSLLPGNLFYAFVIALLFGVHPMHVESVAWVSERKDVLYVFFLLLGLITYARNVAQQRMTYWVLAGIFFLLALLSKAMAVVFPVLCILIDFWKGRDLKSTRPWLEKIPFFIVALIFGLIAVNVQAGGDFYGLLKTAGERTAAVADMQVFSMWQRIQFASYGFFFYIGKFLFPFNLSPFYPYPDNPGLWFSLAPIALIALSGALIYSVKYTRIFAFGVGFYFISVALVLQFLSVGLALTADRYSYLAYIGLAFALCGGTVFLADRLKNGAGKRVVYIWLIAALFYAWLGKSQVKIWENSETLWTAALAVYPETDLALANRGNYLGKSGRIDEAMADFEKALALGTKRWDVYEGLGNSYGVKSEMEQDPIKKKDYSDQSKAMYLRSLELEPNKGNVWYNLGITQLKSEPAQAVTSFLRALELMPSKEAQVRETLAYSYLVAADYSNAIKEYSVLIDQMGVKTAQIYFNRGLARQNLNQMESAKADFMSALALNPDFTEARKALEMK